MNEWIHICIRGTEKEKIIRVDDIKHVHTYLLGGERLYYLLEKSGESHELTLGMYQQVTNHLIGKNR